MDDALVVQIHKPDEHLGDVHRDERLGKLAEALADMRQRPVLAVLEDNVEIFARFDEALVFDDVRVLRGR